VRFGRVVAAVLFGALLMGMVAAAGARLTGEPEVPAPARVDARAEPAYPGGRDALSNILPEDYVGPDACRSCHRENYQRWQQHPHRKMNQRVSEAAVLGDFEDHVLRLESGVATFRHPSRDVFTLTLERPGQPRRSYRVTRTVGSRIKQQYAGVLTEGVPMGVNRPDDEVVMPFGWAVRDRRWMPLDYFDDREGGAVDPFVPTDTALRRACVYCHNTTPYLDRFGSRRHSAVGFDTQMRIDAPTLTSLLAERVVGPAALWPDVDLRYSLERVVTVGISCESCHFGARAHAVDEEDYRFGPSSPHLALLAPTPGAEFDRTTDNPRLVRGICRQCHASEGTGYPDGSSHGNSREALELESGACASQVACTHCHNPHVAGPPEGAGPDNPKQVAACTECHAPYAARSAAEAHARHTAEQASCLDCHMPRITVGIRRAVRSHRISVPGDPRMLGADAPNACNGCHLDRSIGWTLAELERGWGKHAGDGTTGLAHGAQDLERPAGDLWLHSDLVPLRKVAIELVSRRPGDDATRQLLGMLDDPVNATRYYALMALERRVGRRLGRDEVDILAPAATRAQQIAALRRRLDAGGLGGTP